MSIRETSSSGTRPAFSLKAILMTVIIAFFAILHLIGVVLLRDAATTPPIETSKPATTGD